jgi:signal transduction histidine kinase
MNRSTEFKMRQTQPLPFSILTYKNHVFRGEGDVHETAYDGYKQSITLIGTGLFSKDSATYTLSLYPSKELFEVNSTKNPLVATVGAVFIILFTSILFMLYDYFVRQEFNSKKDLLEAKRQFMRFVSHEVRTPLNSVCMGLMLLQEEIERAVCIQTNHDKINALESLGPEEVASSPAIAITQDIEDWLQLTSEIYINTQASIDVLNDLLNYDKIEMGLLQLDLTVIPIWNLIERTTSEFNIAAAQKKIHFLVDLNPLLQTGSPVDASMTTVKKPKDCKVVGDAIRLTQVLRNLISNALKFTAEHGKF